MTAGAAERLQQAGQRSPARSVQHRAGRQAPHGRGGHERRAGEVRAATSGLGRLGRCWGYQLESRGIINGDIRSSQPHSLPTGDTELGLNNKKVPKGVKRFLPGISFRRF